MVTPLSSSSRIRIFRYLRALEQPAQYGQALISSKELARHVGLTDAQVRKDISYLGKCGTPRVGYSIEKLQQTLQSVITKGEDIRVVLFGVGNLGTALLKYPGFKNRRIKIIAAFDVAKEKIGKKVRGVPVYSAQEAIKIIRKQKPDLGIIAVPAEQSQTAANLAVWAGMRALINFAPNVLEVPSEVHVKDIDLVSEFFLLHAQAQGS